MVSEDGKLFENAFMVRRQDSSITWISFAGIGLYAFDKALDLTHRLENGMLVYPGDPSPSFASYKTLERDGVNVMKISLGSHTGTHLDAPRHFIEEGMGIDKIPPGRLIGEAYVADLSWKKIGSGITAEDIRRSEKLFKSDDILVCYTGCSEHWNDEYVARNYTHLTKEAADFLVSKRVRAVGIDFLSVEQFNAPSAVVHKTLLSKGIYIIESLNNAIKTILNQRVLMICMPIKLRDGDGAPSRVIAIPIQRESLGA